MERRNRNLPMHYDDNDFQGQNLQLEGERNSKFSSIIRPYALAKFDLDESLQDHLRFESLVGTEVFLSIDSQESNNWIGDFSRCSSRISFCPGEADSCSISRRNHAWSEAASPESVEMLLKSVGQEEMNEGQTCRDHGPCNDLADLPKDVGPCFSQGDVILYKVEDSPGSQPALQSERFGGLPELNGAAAGESFQSQDIGQTRKCESYVFKSLSNCSYSTRRDKSFLLDGEGCYLDCNDLKDGELVFTQSDAPVNEVQDLSSTIVNNSSFTVDVSASRQTLLNDATITVNLGVQEESRFEITNNSNVFGVQVCEVGDVGMPSIEEVKIDDEKLVEGTNETSVSCDFQDHSDINGSSLEICGDIRESPGVKVHTNWQPTPEISDRFASFGKDGEAKSIIHPEVVLCGHEIGNTGGNMCSTTCSSVEIVDFNRFQAIPSNAGEDPISRNFNDEHFASSSGISLFETDDTEDCGLRGVIFCSKELDGPCFPSTFSLSSISDVPHKVEDLKNIYDSSHVDDFNDKDLNDTTKPEDRTDVPDVTTCSSNNEDPVEEDQDVGLLADDKLEFPPVDKDANKDLGFDNSATDNLMENELGPSTASEINGSQTVDQNHNEVIDFQMPTEIEIVSDVEISLPALDKSRHEGGLLFKGSEGGQSDLVTTAEIVTVSTSDLSMEVSKKSDLDICCQPQVIENENCQKPSEEFDACCTDSSTTGNEDCGKSDPNVNANIEESNSKSLCEEDLSGASGDSKHSMELEKDDSLSTIKICKEADVEDIDKDEAKETSSHEDKDGSHKTPGSTYVCVENNKLTQHVQGNECSDHGKSSCGSPSIIACSEILTNENRMPERIGEVVNENVAFESNEDFREGTRPLPPDARAIHSSIDDKSFSFEVSPLTDIPGNRIWQPFSVPAGNSEVIENTSDGVALNTTDIASCDDVQRTIESKGGMTSTNSVRESSKKQFFVKETIDTVQSEKEEKACDSSPPEVLNGKSEGFSYISRPNVSPVTVSSNLPDLNASAFPSIVFQQPFTDFQQVQLRAQILVYGSLMQGSIPDEACMSSAFGVSDGGRKFWEKIWHASIERFHDQKAQSPNPESPMQATFGTPPTDQTVKHCTLQSKGFGSPICRSSSKSPSTGISRVALPSPLWSVSARLDGVQSSISRGTTVDYPPIPSLSRPYRSPPIRNFISHPSSWMSPSGFHVPWITSRHTQHTSICDGGTSLSTIPSPEIVRLTPAKELHVPNTHGVKLGSPCPASGIAESVFVGNMAPLDSKKITSIPNRQSIELKSRKKKKMAISEDGSPVNTIDSESFIGRSVNMFPSTFVDTSPISTTDRIVTLISPPLITSTVKAKEPEINHGVTLSEESLNKVKEAKLQAEEAADHADATVSHTLDIWSKLEKEKNFGMLSNVEAELASAAATIAAAASIAKAAAAAAKIASNAAFHVKLMADEALLSSGNENISQSSSISDSIHCLGNVSASSVIVAAKEAAQRKIEAASAASKRAETLDAVIKAAELAAEAISQAGKIVAMGDPLPLSDLVKAGPAGFWKLPAVSSEPSITHRGMMAGEIIEDCQLVVSNSPCRLSEKDAQFQYVEKLPCSVQISGDTEDHTRLVDANSVSTDGHDNRLGEKNDNELNKLSLTARNVSESEFGSSSPNFDHARDANVSKGDIIKEGSFVEVFKDEEGYKAAWFLANVLGLKDGNAFVCYNDIPAIEGSGQHKEWVPFVCENDKAPRIRVARTQVTAHLEGTRKRRRSAMSDIVWSVGDRVDAWIKDSWWEGVIRDKRDELAFYIHFPAHEETSVVGVWLLRPSVVWNNGEWVEQPSSRGNSCLEGDAPPQEKRVKLSGPPIEPPTVETLSKNVNVVDADRHGGLSLVNLSSRDKVFAIGNNYRDGRSHNPHKIMRTASQREGSKVIFGVPRTGKKRKLMEVSKNYVLNQSTRNPIANDSAKLAKFFTPPVGGSLNALRRDVKEKRASETRTKVLRSGKTQNHDGTLKDNLLPSALSASQRGVVIDNFENFKNSSGEENTTSKHSLSKLRSFPGGPSKGPVLFSSSSHRSDLSSSRKVSEAARNSNVDNIKLPPARKLAKIEEEKVLTSDVEKSASELTEPRRSNRRIQPTSRMLEGLQSSLNMPKLAPITHDRSHKNGGGRTTSSSSSRGISRGGGAGGRE